jgi:hypothetical protein
MLTLHSRKRLKDVVELLFFESASKLLDNLDEVNEINLALIIFVSCFLQLLDEFLPFRSYLAIQLDEELN